MCGRYTPEYTWEQIDRMYMLIQQAPPSNMPPNYNVCPTQLVDVILATAQGRSLAQMRWGLVPLDARIDTLATKDPGRREREIDYLLRHRNRPMPPSGN